MANVQCDILKRGVLIDGNKLFKLDGELQMTAELFARALTITWSSTDQYWNYIVQRLSGGECIEVAELLNVCWLDVDGHLNTRFLTPCTEYEVLFDIQLKPRSYGFELPVKFTLIDPKGRKFENDKCLNQLRGKGWTQLSIGKFQTPALNTSHNESKVEFRLYEHINGQWKSGLIVRGVIFRPTKASALSVMKPELDQQSIWREVLIFNQNEV